LISDVTSGKITNVLVYKIDRLTRSTKNLIELIDLFNQHDCAFNSLNEAIDTSSATGRMFLKIVGIFAEFERENLAERVRLGFERKTREGYSPGNAIQSYGYFRANGEKVQAVVEEEAEVVKRIFSMYLQDDYSLNKIGRTLDAQNIPTKRNAMWTGQTIKAVLTNPNYVGKVRYSMMDESRYFEARGKHEAIIDEATFSAAREKLERTKQITRTKRPASGVYFCGIIRCETCGGKYNTKWTYKTSATGERIAYKPNYRCSNSRMGKCDDHRSISHKKVVAGFERYIANIENFTEPINAEDGVQVPDNAKEVSLINAEIGQIERKASEVMDLFMANKIDFETYQKMVTRGNIRRDELNARLELLEKIEVSKEIQQNRAEIAVNLRDNWKSLDDEQRLQFIQKFIRKILLHKEPHPDEQYGAVVIDEIVFNDF
jgi:site-specific DNA recombinase